jgi:NADPH:quinone reductase-like Zn-dependent oxidoreductase
VSPNREQLSELARVVDEGAVRPLIDTVFTLDEVRQAFERVAQRGKRGKVVLQIRAEPAAISGSDAG